MSYFLGIDLGTTYTAAAVWRDGRVEIADLGTRTQVIPSVVLVREDGDVLTGEAAERRAVVEPQRIAREFKRRIGDPTPLIVGGTPYSADALTAKLLRSVVDRATGDESGAPAGVAISHPANWGDYKKDLLRQAIRQADLEDVALLTEPEAAAIHYASQARVEPGAVVAVYDLGGGTFDAAVLRRTASSWDILGEPEGVERLGGVDFDEAVFHHVVSSVRDAYERLDPDDPTVLAAVTRLRRECIEAKEALAADTDTIIPVLLPTIQTEVRLTRSEFEDMIRPALGTSIAALQRALRAAHMTAEQVSAVLLVGGSSRIPLVAELVGSAVARPMAVDAHPKHGVALGAAIIAADHASPGVASTSEVEAVEDTTSAATFWTVSTMPKTFQVDAPSESPAFPLVAADGAEPSFPWEAADGAEPSFPWEYEYGQDEVEPAGAGAGTPHPPTGPDPDAPFADDEARRRHERQRRRALGLILGGAAALIVSLSGALVLAGRNEDPQLPTNPDGVPTNATPDRSTTVGEPAQPSTTPGPSTALEAPPPEPAPVVRSTTTTLRVAPVTEPPVTAPPPTDPPPTEPPPTTTTSTTASTSTTTTTLFP